MSPTLIRSTVARLLTLLLTPLAALHAAEPPATFCNPLSIPNYPVGHHARNVTNGEPDSRESWILGHREQFPKRHHPRRRRVHGLR